MSKFASITSSLLARKGEAMPWNESGKAPLPWRMEAPIPMPPAPQPASRPVPLPPSVRPATVPAPHDLDAVRRCTVRMSQREYERLGIMAVKKDLTRQQFLHEALARVLDEIAREFPATCACIGPFCTGEGCGACGKTG